VGSEPQHGGPHHEDRGGTERTSKKGREVQPNLDLRLVRKLGGGDPKMLLGGGAGEHGGFKEGGGGSESNRSPHSETED